MKTYTKEEKNTFDKIKKIVYWEGQFNYTLSHCVEWIVIVLVVLDFVIVTKTHLL